MNVNSLDGLVQPHLADGTRFVSYHCRSLLPPGENYGSIMLALNINVITKHGEKKTIECVAKTVPPSEAIWDLFNIPLSFKKEVAQYTTVVPTLNEFGLEKGYDNLMHFFAKCLGARISLNPESDVVDNDAALILENLKVEGYVVGDRCTGFDLEITKSVLCDLATLHAATIAFKLAKPEEFKTKIRPHLNKSMLYVVPDDVLEKLTATTQNAASQNPKCIPLLSRIEEGMRNMKNIFTYPKIREPFATYMHSDLWTNNILIKFEDGKPVHNIFVDLAVCEYSSPARDVLFFLYSSGRLDVIEKKIDELIKFYYDKLLEVLAKLECDVTLFSFDMFMKEVNEVAKDTEFPHLVYMLTPIMTKKNQAKNLNEWTPAELAAAEGTLHENYLQRLQFIVLDFAKRNWI